MGEIVEFRPAEEAEDEVTEEEAVDVLDEEEEDPEFDMEFFTTPDGANAMSALLKNIGDTIPIMKEMWDASKMEFDLTEDQMHAVAIFNREHITPPTDEEKDKSNDKEWDPFNGISKMTDSDVVTIFGEDHAIHGPTHEITVQRIRECYQDLYNFVSCTKQYQETYDQWLQFQEMVEVEKMAKLKDAVDHMDDGEDKDEAQAALDNYWYLRNLGFLSDPEVVTDDIKKRIAETYNDKRRLEYLMKRSLDKLPKISIPNAWMLELNNFEKRFMDSKYSQKDDLLLLLVLQMLAFCKTDDPSDKRGSFVYSILLGVDSVIRNICSEERKVAMLHNIAAYEDAILSLLDK